MKKRSIKPKIKSVFSLLFFVIGIVGGLYVGGWLMFVQPIIEACKHFDSGTLTGLIVGTTVLKCVFSSVVGFAIYYVCALIGMVLDDL